MTTSHGRSQTRGRPQRRAASAEGPSSSDASTPSAADSGRYRRALSAERLSSGDFPEEGSPFPRSASSASPFPPGLSAAVTTFVGRTVPAKVKKEWLELVYVDEDDVLEMMKLLDELPAGLGDEAEGFRKWVGELLAPPHTCHQYTATIRPYLPSWIPLRRGGILSSNIYDARSLDLRAALILWSQALESERELPLCAPHWPWLTPAQRTAVLRFREAYSLLFTELSEPFIVLDAVVDRIPVYSITVIAPTRWGFGCRCYFSKTYTEEHCKSSRGARLRIQTPAEAAEQATIGTHVTHITHV